MNKSRTGGGVLSRKLYTILMAAGMLTSGTCWAVDNSVYIDQSGDNAVINITQDGAGNTVKALTNNRVDAATISGNGVNLDINQVGSGNTVSLGVSASVVSGRSADITYSTGNNGTTGSAAIININSGGSQSDAGNISVNALQTGNNSRLSADIKGSGSSLSVTTAGAGDSVNATMRGDTNIANITFSGTGGSNQAVTDQSGSGSNSIGINLSSTGNLFGITQAGSNNTVSIGGYTSGSALTGDDNTVQVAQNGTNHTANLGITGASNNVNINQGGSGQDANIKISGASNTINITQGANGVMLPALR